MTTLAEETTLVETLEATGRLEADVVGTSVQGRDIRLLRVGDPPPGPNARFPVLLVAAQHGNETPGREALLELAEWLVQTALIDSEVTEDQQDFLATRGVAIMPTCNPDGVEADSRPNADGVDTNRDHITLATPEAQAVATALGRIRPLSLLDIHSRTQDEDAAFLGQTNPQVASSVNTTASQIITALQSRISSEGWVSVALELSDAQENRLRSNAGLRHSAGVLLEPQAGDDEHEQDVAYAVADEMWRYAAENFAALEGAAETAASVKAAEGAAGTAPFDLRTTTLDPPPLSYRLAAGQIDATAFHRSVYNIVLSGGDTVSMGQAAQPVIPYLLDGDATDSVVSAERVFAGGPGVPGEGGLSPVAQAVIRTRLTWLACDLSSGRVTTELPDLQGDEVSRVIGRYTSASLSLPIPTVGAPGMSLSQRAALAASATQPPRTMIVAVVNDVPTWAGIPLPRERGTDALMPLGTVSLEGYLRHRYIDDHSWDDVDVSVIVAGLLGDAGDSSLGDGIGLVVDAPTIGVTASRDYLDAGDETVYDGLVELMDAGLIEWTIDVDWQSGAEGRIVDKIARVRSRLGVSGAPTAVFSSAVFSSQGTSDATYNEKEDYSGDRYANVVRLRGDGEGEDQPRSTPAVDQAQLDAGVPLWELRDSAPRNVTGQSALDRHAEQRLERVRRGGRTLEITARWSTYPRYGVDWQIGDVIGHELRGHGHPDGLNGVRRAIGFALSIQQGTIRPILQEE